MRGRRIPVSQSRAQSLLASKAREFRLPTIGRSKEKSLHGAVARAVTMGWRRLTRGGTRMHTNSGHRWILSAIFYACVSVLLYLAICISLFSLSAAMLTRGVVFSNEIMRRYQGLYYWSVSGVWINDPKCAVFDPDLIYTPRIGRCEFDTLEFKTTLNFDEHGRVSGNKSEKMGIAVVGDSFSMGHGVNDEETFSAILERMVNRPVYNLGVSSYATHRELLRLEKSGLVPKVDTVIIQYCSNDYTENVHGMTHAVGWTSSPIIGGPRELFDSMYTNVRSSQKLRRWMRMVPWVPIAIVRDAFVTGFSMDVDFSLHYLALDPILSSFPWLNSKRVIVFYTNGPYGRYKNFVELGARSRLASSIFVDLSLGPESHLPLDGHLNERGHRRTAEMLFYLVSAPLPDYDRIGGCGECGSR